MDAGATISALERAAKQEGEKLRVAKRKLAQAEKQADTDRQAICLWLRMVWLLSAGHPHVMTCAWRVRQDDLESIWHPSDVTMEQIWNIVGCDFLEERLGDAEAFSLTEPSSKKDIVCWRRAWEFYCEWQLACAVVQVNVTKKMVAPSEYIHSKYHQVVNADHPCLPNVVRANLLCAF